MQNRDGRGQGLHAPPRNQDKAQTTLQGFKLTNDLRVLQRLKLRPIAPFWDDIPHIDVGKALVPDLLHQLYNGMYEHARNWVEDLLGTKEFNQRFMVMLGAQDLQHFKKGVTGVKVWTGCELRDMMRQFLPVIVDAQAPPDLVRLVRSLLEFLYLVHSVRLSDFELTRMDGALQVFHKAKPVLLDKKDKHLGIVKGDEGFDRIAKLHMLSHYTKDICQFGTPNGYSTETPEHLHIMYMKIPWRMPNRCHLLPQMVGYSRRLEALKIQQAYIKECYGEDLDFDVRNIVFKDEIINRRSGDNCKDEDDSDEDMDSIEELKDPVQIPSDMPTRVIMSSYGASKFTWALGCFLHTKTTQPDQHLILPTNRFPLWHKPMLEHPPLPFAPAKPCHRDIIRVQPPTQDTAGRPSTAGVFDTALFATYDSSSGIDCFCAGRV
ncbi:Zn-finger protein [Ceratobasidium sp. AG-Ba]|nr:Zn-finger protein [Ceratobasidium sp. AG-Ba]